MSIRRIFLDWGRPALPAATDWLIEHHRSGDAVDLDRVVVVVPGGRAGRRRQEILISRVEELGLVFFPPRITTAGQLPESIYQPKRPLASDLVQQLAWAKAIRESDRAIVQQVIRELPTDEDDPRWLDLGSLLRRQHRELAGDGLDFADVAKRGASVTGFDEVGRWQILALVQQAYLRTLDQLGLWDQQTARLVAIQQHECHTDGDVILLGMADMNRTQRRMLDQVAERVTALVTRCAAGPIGLISTVVLILRGWLELPIAIETDQVQVVDGPKDQAAAVLDAIAAYDGRYRADRITIGVPDETLIPHLEHQLVESDLRARWGPGTPVSESAPYRLLTAVGAQWQDGRYKDFAALVRHADMARWIGCQGIRGDWLTELDRYYGRHLPGRLAGQWLGEASESRLIRQVDGAVRGLLEPLTSATRRLGQWYQPLVQLLLNVYGREPLDVETPAQRRTLAACESVAEALSALTEIPDELAPRVTATAAINLALGQLAAKQIPAAADADAIELLGWLELPLDDAPALVVTSLNEGIVPQSVNSDLFLPNSLRSQLGLDDNARRYARDAYALSALLASRERVNLIVGRHDEEGNPCAPSRLLFAADPPTIAQRTLAFFGHNGDSRQQRSAAGGQPGKTDRRPFSVPRPAPLDKPITRLSPTLLRTYLVCPYRFYLQHVLKLEMVADDARELDAGAFGTLVHAVLCRFGCSSTRDSNDPEEIAAVLDQLLDECVAQSFGKHALPAVRVQVEQMRLRLHAFAEEQAQWARRGWRIEHTEVSGRDGYADFIVDGQPLQLAGRIDRIDIHEDTGQRVILDYKSSDSGDLPDKVHRRNGQWIDLQLPLYRHVARGLGIDGPVRLGYGLLPKDTTKVGFAVAEWTEAELEEADELARTVVRGIRQERFWPPAEVPPAFMQQFAPICQDGGF